MGMTGALRRAGINVVPNGIQIDGSLISDNLVGDQGVKIYVDPLGGNDSYTGRTPGTAVATIAVGYAKLTAGQNDMLVYLAGTTSASIVDQLIWAKDYTHFVGVGAPSWVGQRARIFNSGVSTSTYSLLKIAARGCTFQNLMVWQGSAIAHCGAIEVTAAASRNYYKNLHIAGMCHATASAGVNAYSLYVNGGYHSLYEDCTIGWTSIKRTGAATRQAQIIFDAGASWNLFKNCHVLNWSETAGHSLILEADSASMAALNEFDDCMFYNFWTNHGGTLTELFDTNEGATHDTVFRNPSLVGIDEIDAGDVTGVYVVGPDTHATAGLALTPTT